MKRVSTARAKQLREYAKKKPKFLREHKECFVCGQKIDLIHRQLHHVYGRVGRLLCWEPGWRMAGPDCHEEIHERPFWAIRKGYLAPMGCFNDFNRAVKHHQTTTYAENHEDRLHNQ